ncbi:hypothetical protein [Nostoc sp.]|uniref:hypothetical protein n=1 Tax=Nostoc sp. TaxID=1180 RepID=UPI002FF9E1B8
MLQYWQLKTKLLQLLKFKLGYAQTPITRKHYVFLFLAGFLGVTCTVAYTLTGSLFAIVLIHWIVVVVWLIVFGGIRKLDNNQKIQNTKV